jgi:hypothetical protein
MDETEMAVKLAELDRLLNDPETRMDPHRVWALAAELSAAALYLAASLAVNAGARATMATGALR